MVYFGSLAQNVMAGLKYRAWQITEPPMRVAFQFFGAPLSFCALVAGHANVTNKTPGLNSQKKARGGKAHKTTEHSFCPQNACANH